jgi:hypothetical protein
MFQHFSSEFIDDGCFQPDHENSSIRNREGCAHRCAYPLQKRGFNALAIDMVVFENKSSELEVFRL